MKKLSFSLLVMLGLFATIFIACDEDDNGVDILPPSITSPSDASVDEGATVDLSFPVNTPGGFQSASVASSDDAIATAAISTNLSNGVESGTIVVTVTGVAEGEATVTLTVTDAEATSANDDVVITVEALDAPDAVATLGDTIASIESLSTLAAALDATGLDDVLNGEDGPYTVFAPNNDAFTALLTALELNDLDAVVAALGAEGVTQLLLAHVVADSLGAAEVTAATDSLTTASTNGDMLGITVEGENVFVNGAQILEADIVAGNGVIHIIDSVINLPDLGGPTDPIVPDSTQVAADDAALEVALELIGNFNAVQDVGVSLMNVVPSSSLEFVTSQLAAYPEGDFFTEVGYKGAFDPSASATWLDGWSLLSRGGYLGGTAGEAAAFDAADTTGDASVLVNLPAAIDGDVTLDADSIYKINGYTFVEDGTLTIEAGAIVIAETTPTTGDPISALIITRSAMIDAQGTADNPIIMTSENDTGILDESSTGEWGGLVVLGQATANDDGADEIQIEGIPESIPALYGAIDGVFNDEDNSGTIRYVSIRYTGDAIAAGNELQGLTLGGVGSGTTIEYVESFASSDDGVEVFGGSPNLKYFAVAFAEDDSYDFDIGYKGNIQFGFALQGGNGGDNLIEWDGAVPDGNAIFSDPTLYNMTFIGVAQSDQGILMRDNTAGVVANSIIVDEGTKGIQVENLADSDADSYNRLINGEIELLNNLWYLGDTFTEINSTDAGVVLATE